MDELACFAPGMIALGSSGYDPEDSKKYLTLAEEVKSCKLFSLWDDLGPACFRIFATLKETLYKFCIFCLLKTEDTNQRNRKTKN